ncbi:MAG: hypothetical protein ACREQ3_09965 [Candidatus Binatia bacterium]
MTPSSNALVFFLGGHDLEMITIRDLLLEVAPDRFYDKQKENRPLLVPKFSHKGHLLWSTCLIRGRRL